MVTEFRQPEGRGCWGRTRSCVSREPLLLATVIGVIAGVVAGCVLHALDPSERVLEGVGFPGEILMRLLKLVVLPLVAGSMIAGVCSLRESTFGMGKVARVTLLYYLITTVIAVLLGLLVVITIRPGRWHPFKGIKTDDEAIATKEKPDVMTAILDVLRNLFPKNAFVAAGNLNILGVITMSILFGLGLTSMGPEADEFVHLIRVFNSVIEKVS